MRTLHACAYVAITAFAVACGGGDGDAKPDAPPIIVPDAPTPDAFEPPQPDAQQFDFSCMNDPEPTTAPATVSLSGTANEITANFSFEPVADAAVRAFKNGNPDTQVGTTQSDANGAWSLPAVPTATMPIDGYIEATKLGYRTSRLYPSEPISGDIAQAPVLLLSTNVFSSLFASQSQENGTVALAVLDCANTPIDGAAISVKQNGVEVGTQQDLSQFQPGTFIVLNVPPGVAEVGATYMGMTLRAHVVSVVAETTSTTLVRPGF